jgi:hypothetical protein
MIAYAQQYPGDARAGIPLSWPALTLAGNERRQFRYQRTETVAKHHPNKIETHLSISRG